MELKLKTDFPAEVWPDNNRGNASEEGSAVAAANSSPRTDLTNTCKLVNLFTRASEALKTLLTLILITVETVA